MKRRFKAGMLVLLSLIMVYVLAACSGSNNSNNNGGNGGAASNSEAGSKSDNGASGSDSGKVDSLRLIMVNDPWVDAAKSFAARYEDETGIKVEVEAYGYDQTHQKEVMLGTLQSDTVDIIVLDSPWVGEFAEAGITADLTERVNQTPELDWDDYIPSFAKVSQWKGKIVGIPFAPY